MVANPHCRLSELRVLTEDERRQILFEWNGTSADYSEGICVHQLFEAQAERTPEAIAAVYEDSRFTYHELNERANRLANHLRDIGVGSEALCGIYMERSMEMLVAMLGILKAGGAYLPLDPTYPAQRISFMLEDSKASFVLTQDGLVDSLTRYEGHIICLT